jgi:hypothetical protein
MAQAVCRGEKLLLSEASEKLLGGCRKDITGAENIPKDGPLLVISNHWKDGPLWGMWQSFLISELTNKERNQEVGWIIQDSFEVSLGIPKTNLKYKAGKELWASKYILDLVSSAYNLTTVTAPFKLQRGKQEHFVPISAFRRLKRGEIVGLYPEATKTKELAKPWEGSGAFVNMVAEKIPGTQILPVGVFSERKRKSLKLSLKFGEPIPIGQCKDREPVEIADGMMAEIASLMPLKYQGEYKIFK